MPPSSTDEIGSSLTGSPPTRSNRRTPSPTNHRGNVDDDLVEEPVLQALPGDVRAEDDNVAVARGVLGGSRRLRDVDVQKAPGDALDDRLARGGGSCRNTKNGPRKAPP